MSVETKLSAARTRLILDKPFLGALVLRLPMKEADPEWCTTTATDARHFYYNAEYIDALEPAHVQFVLAHEALHCALSHFARRQHRDQKRWDVACDLAVNSLLVNDGLIPPPGVLHDMGFDGLTAEEIYPSIHDELDEPLPEPQDKHVYDDVREEGKKSKQGRGGEAPDGRSPQPQESSVGVSPNSESDRREQGGLAEQPQPLTPDERETLNTQWQQRLAGAAQIAQQAGKMGGVMARLVDHLLQPQLPWRNLLAHHVSTIARDDYSYSRPSTRRGDPAVYPSLRSAQINVTVVLDTSGSIIDEDFQEFLSEIDAIKSQMRARIVLHACDAVLLEDGPWIFEPWEEVSMPREFTGGGGTSFEPPFDWCESQDVPPDMLIYFTDAKGVFPKSEPGFPVLWLVKGKEPVPWGTRIQLN
ncbi:vWA domain-containing protein [Kaarinaea lacus]